MATRRKSEGTAADRLTQALATLIRRSDSGEPQNATVSELCRLAGVSRNSLYRYHAEVLTDLRKHQCRRLAAAQSKTRNLRERQRTENLALRGQISSLAALVDHYYAAYRETAALLARRDRELAELRRCTKSKLTLVQS